MNVSQAPLSRDARLELRGQPAEVPGNTILRLPGTILFGCGTIDRLGSVVSSEGRSALVCSDPGVSSSPAYEGAIRSLRFAGITPHTYLETPMDVPVESVLECVDAVSGQDIDVVVGIGGGSVIDLAKLVALSLTQRGSLSRYYGENKVPGPCLPVVAVPTTAGTGSEVTPVAVLRDPDQRMKVGVSSRFLIPTAAVCDPEVTISCPSTTTAYAGIDALAHALEAYTAAVRPTAWEEYPGPVFRGKNYFSDLHALTAIRMIHGTLERVVSNGDDLQARTTMLFGSLSAGLSFAQAGTAGAHALQYPIGAMTSTPHGLGVGVLMPHVLEFIRPAAEPELAIIGRTMGVSDEHMPDAESAELAIDEVSRLTRAVGLPGSLADLGIDEADLPQVADEATTISRLLDNSPRKLDRDALLEILRAAWRSDRPQDQRVGLQRKRLGPKESV